MMVRFVLLDIEGTTTDINFVRNVLFPYAASHLAPFLSKNSSDPFVDECISAVKRTVLEEDGKSLNFEEVVEKLLYWITTDRKHPALKGLQGLVWQNGYAEGHFRGHVYPDVVPVLKAWKESGLGIGIFSSGSVLAQKLLFRHSDFGDLTPYFSHHFDTTTGPKVEAGTYTIIASVLALQPHEILFLSDIEKELDAAAAAGLKVVHLARGIPPVTSCPSVASFADIAVSPAPVA